MYKILFLTNYKYKTDFYVFLHSMYFYMHSVNKNILLYLYNFSLLVLYFRKMIISILEITLLRFQGRCKARMVGSDETDMS